MFAETGDMTLLGVRTIEGFGVLVDNVAHRFVAQATIVAHASSNRVDRCQARVVASGRSNPPASLDTRSDGIRCHRTRAARKRRSGTA